MGLERWLSQVKLGTVDEGTGSCMVAIKIHLPKELYVDLYELISLNRHNITEALEIGDYVDLEVPEYLATEIAVLVYIKPDPECHYCFRAILPLHCRYHQPAEVDEKISAMLKSPEILVHCQKRLLSTECLKETKIEEPCSWKNKHNCHWDSVKFQLANQELELQIPGWAQTSCYLSMHRDSCYYYIVLQPYSCNFIQAWRVPVRSELTVK